MIAVGVVQGESADGDLGHSDLVLEGYRVKDLSASRAARNLDSFGEEFDGHSASLCEWLRFRSKTAPWA
jgi:hypothetical protein